MPNQFDDHEALSNSIRKANDTYLALFLKELKAQSLSNKTISKHMDNVRFYLNEFLLYYEPVPMRKGMYEIDEFFGDWFPRKCLWASPTSVKENTASLKKFYGIMRKLEKISEEDHQELIRSINENKSLWIETSTY